MARSAVKAAALAREALEDQVLAEPSTAHPSQMLAVIAPTPAANQLSMSMLMQSHAVNGAIAADELVVLPLQPLLVEAHGRDAATNPGTRMNGPNMSKKLKRSLSKQQRRHLNNLTG